MKIQITCYNNNYACKVLRVGDLNTHIWHVSWYGYENDYLGYTYMQYLGLAPTHGTQHCMGFKQKIFSWDFWCVDFWVVTVLPP